ncbi:MAG: hypothetical protein MSC30_05745 [Gaiellaceae bacterium MAG52_C11]|nr:hypothetical protein [Candidatus Gaiellasilicea maunaloa]
MEPSGKLELTWTNKHLRLLADEESGYQWVPPADYRVAEVRLLHDVVEVGETHADRARAKDNLLIRGSALTSLCELLELAREYVGKVKLCYLDPPIDLRVSRRHDRVPLSFLHELGHLIDHQLAPEPRHFASTGHPVLKPWRAAARALPSRVAGHAGRSHRRYFDSCKELWARS